MFNLDVNVVKYDNVYAQVQTEDFDFIIMMREFFSFFAEGYQFNPRYINKQWDGKIHLLDYDGLIYLGLWDQIEAFCKRHNKPCHIDPAMNKNTLPRDKFDNFVKRLDVHTGGESITPYDYQQDAAHFALEYQRCLLLSPTSSGKSLIQYILTRMYEMVLKDGEQGLIVVPRSSLVTQLKADFKDYASNIEWDVDSHVHAIEGTCKDTNKKFTISTFQSLTNAVTKPPREWFQKFAAIMVDEVHTATAKSVMYILESCTNAVWRVGLTGTLDESKTNEMTLRGLFGPIMTVTTTKELMDAGTVAQLKIKMGILKHPDKICKFMRSAPRGPVDTKTGKPKRKRATYQEEIDIITTSVERNRMLMRFTSQLKGNTILMINKVEHGENLYKWMKEVLPDRKIYLYTGKVKKDEREVIRQMMELEDGSIIIGSLGVLSTGISIKRLHNLVFAHPTKSRVKTLQSVGRILRKSKFGNDVTCYDFVDDYSIGAFENYTLHHGRDRCRFYNDQLFDVDMVTIPIKEAA